MKSYGSPSDQCRGASIDPPPMVATHRTPGKLSLLDSSPDDTRDSPAARRRGAEDDDHAVAPTEDPPAAGDTLVDIAGLPGRDLREDVVSWITFGKEVSAEPKSLESPKRSRRPVASHEEPPE